MLTVCYRLLYTVQPISSHTEVWFHVTSFLGATRSIEPNSYGNVGGWLAGWVAGCLSQPVLYQND